MGQKTGGLGFEPRQTDSESAVLPLHHPPRDIRILNNPRYPDKPCDNYVVILLNTPFPRFE